MVFYVQSRLIRVIRNDDVLDCKGDLSSKYSACILAHQKSLAGLNEKPIEGRVGRLGAQSHRSDSEPNIASSHSRGLNHGVSSSVIFIFVEAVIKIIARHSGLREGSIIWSTVRQGKVVLGCEISLIQEGLQ